MINYSKLWTILSEYGISKTEFMKQLGVSSATIAKLSGNQPVTMDILERICSKLGCSLDNIVSFTADSDIPTCWSGIDDTTTYLIYFYFMKTDDTEEHIQYLYGYTCPYIMTEEGLDNWSLSRYKDFTNIFEVKGYCIGSDLLTMLNQLEQNLPFGQIMEQNHINIKCTGCKDDIKDRILLVSLFQGVPQYRPAYLLESCDNADRIVTAFRPQVGMKNYTMRCESLVSGNTRDLYYEGLKPDSEKIMLLHHFLKTIYRNASANDMSRLGNFEVLSYLNNIAGEQGGISWKIVTQEESKKREVKADFLEIVLDHHVFSGHYALLIRVCNTQNCFLERLELIHCEQRNYVYNVPLQESPGTVEIRLYQPSCDSFGTNLVADSSATLIRTISIDMGIVERRFSLEDSWTEMMKKNKKKVDSTGEYTSHETFTIENDESEIWFKDEQIVSEECGRIMNSTSKGLSELFFEKGDDKHLRFLDWLKKTLKNTRCKHIVIIDPYINADAIGKILRNIDNPSITYDIYMSTEKEDEIENIKKIIMPLKLVAPASFNIYAISGKALHDRFLILECKDDFEPKVYVMTNSLDNVAQKHASLVIPLDVRLAVKVNKYYLALIEEKRNEGMIEEIFSVSKQETSTPVISEHKKDITLVQSIEEYEDLCVNDLASALEQLAYMEPGELKNKCKSHLSTVNGIGDKLKQILDAYRDDQIEGEMDCVQSQRQNYETRQLVCIAQNLLKDMDLDLTLLDSADCINDYYFEALYIHEEWLLTNAMRYICRIEPKEAIAYLSALCEDMQQEKPKIQLRKYKLSAMLVVQLINLMHYIDDEERIEECMLASSIPFLRAIVITKRLHNLASYNEETLHNITSALKNLCQGLSYKEQLLTHVYCIQRLQVCYCRKKKYSEEVQNVIDEIIEITATLIKTASDADDKFEVSLDDLYRLLHALYSRNKEDICKVYISLVQKEYIVPKKAGEYLVSLLLEPFEKGMQNEKNEFYQSENLYESRMILQYMNTIHPDSINSAFTAIKKYERKLGGFLYSATLKEQNYSQWKCYMDIFACFVYLELYTEKEFGHKTSKAVTEFKKISSNYKKILTDYSEVYKELTREFEL